jgi:hypothetical protein
VTHSALQLTRDAAGSIFTRGGRAARCPTFGLARALYYTPSIRVVALALAPPPGPGSEGAGRLIKIMSTAAQVITRAELAEHTSHDDCWLAVDGMVRQQVHGSRELFTRSHAPRTITCQFYMYEYDRLY